MCTTTFRALAALSLAALSSVSGCVDSDDDLGTVNINLVGQGSSGQVYRLRDATFTVDGPAPTVWNTEDDPDRTTLSADVPVGAYTATLAPGWRLERLTPGMPPVTVVSSLVSSNPIEFAVNPGVRTSVPFRFTAEGDMVDLTQGYDITIGVDDLGTAILTNAMPTTILEGSTYALPVRLATAPATPVTVAVTVSDPSVLAVMPATLTFNAANYDVPQTVVVMAVNDPDVASEMAILTMSAMGLPAVTVPIFVQDTNVQTIVTNATNITLAEGSSATLAVSLAAPPASNVMVNVVSSDASAVQTSTVSLIFTPANFNVPQTVLLAGVADADLVNEIATITLASPGIASVTVAVNVMDDDVQSIVTSVDALTLVEGTNATFGVRLAAQPPAPVTIQITMSISGVVSLTPTTLTFTPANWSTNQIVNVVALQDGDALDEDVVLNLTAAGVASRTVFLDVIDNDV